MQSSQTNGNGSSALERVNAIYAQIAIGKHLDVLETPPLGYEALWAKKILLLDDSAWVFELYAGPLMQLTGGNAYFLLHEGLNLNSLVETIAGMEPAFALIDANLDAGVNGIDLTAELTKRAPGIRCIGFSNTISYAPYFAEAGAVGSVRKRSDDVWGTLGEVNGLIEAMNEVEKRKD